MLNLLSLEKLLYSKACVGITFCDRRYQKPNYYVL